MSEQLLPEPAADACAGLVRIGELARRTGVSPELLRAWERRYALLHPARTVGGFRLYSPADEARVRRMQSYVSSGLAASQAAELALGAGAPGAEALGVEAPPARLGAVGASPASRG